MSFPGLDLRRTYLIARRDYLGYIKTWGFWISFFLPVIFGVLGFFASTLDINVQPTRYEAILDDTGKFSAPMRAMADKDQWVRKRAAFDTLGKTVLSEKDRKTLLSILETKGDEAARVYFDTKIPGIGKRLRIPEDKTLYIEPPAKTIEGLQPYLRGEKMVDYEGLPVRLNGVLHIYKEDYLHANYWSENFNNGTVRALARKYFKKTATDAYLKSGNLTAVGLEAAQKGLVDISSFNPSKISASGDGSKAVTVQDKAPYFVAFALSLVLWFTVFSGSYMLLTSMLEEKLNKLLEMMLASTRFSEIMCGKLIGVAALTLTAMLPYIIIGIASVVFAMKFGDPELAAGLRDAFNAKMIIFFVIFLVLGYVFYGAFFIAMGAMANSMQDAQTLTTPIMLILTSCVFIVPIGLRSPDSPILDYASWFPLSAPFASIVRLPTNPPLWELILSAFLVFLSAAFVIWVAGRLFRYGVLSGSGVQGIKGWFARKILRRKT